MLQDALSSTSPSRKLRNLRQAILNAPPEGKRTRQPLGATGAESTTANSKKGKTSSFSTPQDSGGALGAGLSGAQGLQAQVATGLAKLRSRVVSRGPAKAQPGHAFEDAPAEQVVDSFDFPEPPPCPSHPGAGAAEVQGEARPASAVQATRAAKHSLTPPSAADVMLCPQSFWRSKQGGALPVLHAVALAVLACAALELGMSLAPRSAGSLHFAVPLFTLSVPQVMAQQAAHVAHAPPAAPVLQVTQPGSLGVRVHGPFLDGTAQVFLDTTQSPALHPTHTQLCLVVQGLQGSPHGRAAYASSCSSPQAAQALMQQQRGMPGAWQRRHSTFSEYFAAAPTEQLWRDTVQVDSESGSSLGMQLHWHVQGLAPGRYAIKVFGVSLRGQKVVGSTHISVPGQGHAAGLGIQRALQATPLFDDGQWDHSEL